MCTQLYVVAGKFKQLSALYPVCAYSESFYEAGHVSRPDESPFLSSDLMLDA